MPKKTNNKHQTSFNSSIDKVKWVMEQLRDPDTGCPWDREQTNESILPYTLEEAYEVADAIEHGTTNDLKEELGDLLFQIIFYTQIASERNEFTFDDVADSIAEKMIFRHPHVFGDVKVNNADDVYAVWDTQKDKEQNKSMSNKGALEGVTRALPALLRAQKLQKKAARVGFEWNGSNDAFLKVQEEIVEFKEAINDTEKEEEFGDLLFALVNFGRMEGLNAEEALRKANNKFVKRFEGMEKKHSNLKNLTLEQMLEAWNEQKQPHT
jgi:ATP diphosphatase